MAINTEEKKRRVEERKNEIKKILNEIFNIFQTFYGLNDLAFECWNILENIRIWMKELRTTKELNTFVSENCIMDGCKINPDDVY